MTRKRRRLITLLAALFALGAATALVLAAFNDNLVFFYSPSDLAAKATSPGRRIRIGAIPFRVAKPCGRCVVTTTDQITGQRGRQPLKMLGQRRRFGKELVFGQNLIPDSGGVIRVGDPVEILDAA